MSQLGVQHVSLTRGAALAIFSDAAGNGERGAHTPQLKSHERHETIQTASTSNEKIKTSQDKREGVAWASAKLTSTSGVEANTPDANKEVCGPPNAATLFLLAPGNSAGEKHAQRGL